MELWIRSQSRSMLIKATDVHLDYVNRIMCDKYFLGKYKTEERAMEILDEIQNILFNKPITISPIQEQQEKEYERVKNAIKYEINIPTIRNASVEYIEPSCVVFEMPQE